MTNNDLDAYKETGGQKFEGYSSFKSSDMSKELETKIPVMAQNLEVSKRLIENKVKIIKEPIKEIKKIDLELTHEEIIIERIPSKNVLFFSSIPPSNDRLCPIKNRTCIPTKTRRTCNKKTFVC